MVRLVNMNSILLQCFGALFCLLAGLFFCALPANAAGELSIQIINGYNLVVDSNVTAPSTYAPESAYIGARICNTGDAALDDVTAYVGDYTNGTPGIFPVLDSSAQSAAWDAAHPQLVNTGDYSLTIEAGDTGAADGTRYIGTLEAGECRVEYWLFSYPQCVNIDPDSDGIYTSQEPACDASITGGIKPDDDLTLDYDVWATTSTAGVSTEVQTRDFTMRNEISAAANKIWPNTDSKVPDEYLAAIESVVGWGTLGPDGQPLTTSNPIYPGQRVITTQGIWYDLGNVVHGFDNNNDLVVDQNAWLQPVGNPDMFDADCFRMINLYGIVIVKLKSGGDLLIPFQNELYFENLPDNNGVVGLVYYQFIATDQGCNGAMTPYQEAASGYDNEKFCADYGLGLELLSGSFGTDLTVAKSDGVASIAPGGTLTYTMSANNTNTGVNLGAPDLGTPLVFYDTIPAGTVYVAGSAVAALTVPSGTGSYIQGYTDQDNNLDSCTLNFEVSASDYKVFYSVDNGLTWTLTEPATAADVTDIRWMLMTDINLDGGHDGNACVAPDGVYNDGTVETSLPAGMSTSVQFQVDVDSNGGPIICNKVGLGFGQAASSLQAQDCTLVTGDNTLSGTVFEDAGGTTGTYGNGIQDGDEAGIGSAADGVVVSLYYDLNADGELDSGDIVYGTTTADANGDYSFTFLPDGPYLVAVRKYDGAGSDGTDNAVDDFNAGWGNTTSDPNLPPTTDQGILKMSEDLTTVVLAVNIDLDNSEFAAQSVTDVDFGFAPPLEVTKNVALNKDGDGNDVADNPIDEGKDFKYMITLENRLPSVGEQGPTGCEYTVWSRTGTNGSPANKAFTDYEYAFDALVPNGTVASAYITGGANRFLTASVFNHAERPGNITKVEAMIFAYYDDELDDDMLHLTASLPGQTDEEITLSSSYIESYVGAPDDLKPNSAISWDISGRKPGGTGAVTDWAWTDFSNLSIEVDPSKAANADPRTFFLDAVGIRVTTDVDCQAGESTTLSPVPLEDQYDPAYFEFISADPEPTSVNTTTGVIQWDDVGPILPGTSRTVIVTLRPYDVDGLLSGSCSGSEETCNFVRTDYSTYNVYYEDGRLANDDFDQIAVDIQGKGEIRGTVWSDINNDGWPNDDGEDGYPNVPVTLYACMQSDNVTLETDSSNNQTCETITSGNYWAVYSITTTDAGGNYEFLGLDNGYYIVEVNDTDGTISALAGGNAPPYGGTQTAEPDDDQSATGTYADAPTQGAYNNTWGSRSAKLKSDQSEINFLNGTAEETVNGVNFGYYQPDAVIYGRVWHDVNGNASADAIDTGLGGFTVELYSGVTLVASTETNYFGDYMFGSLTPDDYVVVVTPPTLLNNTWTETVESTGGTASLNNQIPVTVLAGEFSGSHDFGYTLGNTSSIGDTLYIDFDADGIQDATEDPIPNITVYLYADVDRDGTIDEGVDALLATDVTDSDGKYLFEGLANGSYVVKVDITDPDFPSDVTPTADPDTNAGSIGNLVWLDADGDGTKDAGEDGIPDVSVLLYEDTNLNGSFDLGIDLEIAATTTDVNGNYLFAALNAGNYFVDVDETTLPDSALALTTSDPNTTMVTLSGRSITDSYLDADAGYSPVIDYAMASRVWYDDDGDNYPDPGEAGIGGVTITITGPGCSPCTTVTDANGYWMFTGLVNGGTYSVSVDTGDLTSGLSVTRPDDLNTISVTISGADNTSADFGYKYDPDNDENYAEDADDEPTGTISGSVFTDSDGDEALDSGEEMSGVTVNLFDDEDNLVATTTTAADGSYLFTGVSIGTYSVQAVDEVGVQFSTLFLSAGSDYTNLNVIYNQEVLTSFDSQSSVNVRGVHDNLMQDFGYQRYLGAIGDTVYQDVNENADQDPGEPGLEGVTVYLYLWNDTDGEGDVDAGELILQKTAVTTADDPLTPGDESGKYLFSNLVNPPAGQYYVIQVDTTTLPGTGYMLIGDPDTDGTPCPLLPDPDDPDDEYPPPGACDSLQVVDGYTAGLNYLGADFGYQITGSGYGVIGDYVWVDGDGDGMVDGGEPGVPYITVFMDTDNDNALDWTDANGNGVWDSGEGERWVETDAGGYYVFTGLADGTYNNIKVLTSDTDWPNGLLTTPVYEARIDNDDSLNGSVSVVISGGAVTSIIDGDADTTDTCTDCNLNVDFGYLYDGSNALSGTICMDDVSSNGYCGSTDTTYSGVDTAGGEAPLAGITVTFYKWDDDSVNGLVGQAWDDTTGALDTADAFTLLWSVSTDANGDYATQNLPDDVIVVFSVPAASSLDLTTTNGTTSLEDANVDSRQLFEGTSTFNGEAVTVFGRQALKDLDLDADNDVKDVDYAFEGLVFYDYGDLPDSGVSDYNATLLASGGARHLVTADSIHLGADISTENEGKDSPDASADTYDDGVTIPSATWGFGTDATVVINASDAGWVAGWLDFNQDGDFNDPYENIVNQAVTAGDNNILFYVPVLASGTYQFNARFRIYPEEPLLVSYKGTALNATLQATTGEVEDYQWVANVTYARISGFQAYGHSSGGPVIVEWQTTAQAGTLGFRLARLDDTGKREYVTDQSLPALVTPHGGVYRCLDPIARPGETYTYELIELEASGKSTTNGPFTVKVDTLADGTEGDLSGDLFRTGYSHSNREVYPPPEATMAESDTSKSFDEFFKPNKMVTGSWLTRAFDRALDTSAIPAGPLTGIRDVKLIIDKSGLYRVESGELATALNVLESDVIDAIAAGKIRLTNLGMPVAYFTEADNAVIYFYGEAFSSIYTDNNVYWLKLMPENNMGDLNGDGMIDQADLSIGLAVMSGLPDEGLRPDYAASDADVNGNGKVDMTELAYIRNALAGFSSTPSGAIPSTTVDGGSFVTNVHFERDTYFKTDVPIAASDFWFWDFFTFGNPMFGPAYGFDPFPMAVPAVAPGNSYSAELTVNCHGFSNHPHQAQVVLNQGTGNELFLGEVSWSGFEPVSKAFSFNQLYLNDGANTVKIKSLRADDAFGVDSFDLMYHRSYMADGDMLHFAAGGNAVITVSGFTEPDISLFDLTDPKLPKRVTNVAIDTTGNRITVEPAETDTPYLALSPSAIKAPQLLADKPSNLKDPSNRANYLVITADDLAGGAQLLADYRLSRGMTSMVVRLSDVFDEFSFGIYDPPAIHDFIARALSDWSMPPQYVVLVGDGTFDYKENLAFFSFDVKNLMPVEMVNTPFGIYASDKRYGDVDGDGLSNVFLGRVPAKTDAEVSDYVNKIMAYETGAPGDRDNVLMLADNPDEGLFNNFPVDSDAVSALVSGFTVDKVYYPGRTTAQMRNNFVTAVNSGEWLVNYIGHGGYDVMSNFFSTGNQGLLTNSQYPVYIALTCLVGDYAYPWIDTLSEKLVMKSGGGMIAAWSPTGLSINSEAVRMNKELFKVLFSENESILGRAVNRALERYRSLGELKYPYMQDIYSLLGDPALKIQ